MSPAKLWWCEMDRIRLSSIWTGGLQSPPARGIAACLFTLTAEYLSGADLRGRVGRSRHRELSMRTIITVGLTGMLALGMTGIAMAQQQASQQQGPSQSTPGDPRPTVDRSGTRSSDKGPGTHPEPAQTGQTASPGAPRQNSGAVRQESKPLTPRPGPPDSCNQRRNAPPNRSALDRPPEAAGKRHAGAHARWRRKQTASSFYSTEMSAKPLLKGSKPLSEANEKTGAEHTRALRQLREER